MPKDKKDDPTWYSTPNALRGNKQVNMTLSPETIAGIEALKGPFDVQYRSEVVGILVENELRRKKIKIA